MKIGDNVTLFFSAILFFTNIIWLFMKLKEVNVSLLNFYAICGICAFALCFFMTRNILFLMAVSIYIVFYILQPSFKTSKAFVFLITVLQGIIFSIIFKPLIFVGEFLQILSLLLVGFNTAIAFFNLILGHWYLVVPDMSISHFVRTNRVFSAFSVFRVIFLVICYFILREGFSIQRLMANFYDMMLLGKLLLLQVGSFGVSLMSLDALKWRSTQSATGLFYIVVVFAIADFMVSLYLLKQGYNFF